MGMFSWILEKELNYAKATIFSMVSSHKIETERLIKEADSHRESRYRGWEEEQREKAEQERRAIEHAKEEITTYLKSEEFIDSVVKRIRDKQI